MSTVIHTLLNALIDYAGLFPPAALPMSKAVENYARYHGGEMSFALGRFVVPVAKLRDFGVEHRKLDIREPWRLSVLAGADLADELRTVAEFNIAHAGRAVVDSFEIKGSDAGAMMRASHLIPPTDVVYFEIPPEEDPRPLVAVVAEAGRRAKIRTGGVTPAAFPSTSEIVRFLARCGSYRVPLKATAGLHHPFRCVKPLTYETDSPTGTMNGFVNLFLAAALLYGGASPSEVEPLLDDDDASHFVLTGKGIEWRGRLIAEESIRRSRQEFALSFGSCSFEEPLDDLRRLGWI